MTFGIVEPQFNCYIWRWLPKCGCFGTAAGRFCKGGLTKKIPEVGQNLHVTLHNITTICIRTHPHLGVFEMKFYPFFLGSNFHFFQGLGFWNRFSFGQTIGSPQYIIFWIRNKTVWWLCPKQYLWLVAWSCWTDETSRNAVRLGVNSVSTVLELKPVLVFPFRLSQVSVSISVFFATKSL